MPHHRSNRIVIPARLDRAEHGMTTAEYAVGTVSACGFAALLYEILTSAFARSLLESIIGSIVGTLPF